MIPEVKPEGYVQLPSNKNGQPFYLAWYQVKKIKKVILAHTFNVIDPTHL